MDLAPNYAGTMMGITNTIGNFAGFVAPYITGLIINGQVKSYFLTISIMLPKTCFSLAFYEFNTANSGGLEECFPHIICGLLDI